MECSQFLNWTTYGIEFLLAYEIPTERIMSNLPNLTECNSYVSFKSIAYKASLDALVPYI